MWTSKNTSCLGVILTAGLSMALSVAPATPTANAQSTGLVAAYNFDEGSGTTLTDRSGMNNHGTITNPIWNTTGKYNGSLTFNGTDTMVTVNDSSSLDFTTGMTLEAWVLPTATLPSWPCILFKEQTGNLTYSLYANSDTNAPSGFIYKSGQVGARGINKIALNSWTHLAITYDNINLRFYVNGVLVGTTPHSGNIVTSNNPLRIGGNTIWGEFFTGQIDDIRAYNRALSASEIVTDMNTPVGGTVTNPPATNSLVAAFNFNEGSGTTLNDISGTGNNGVITNAAWDTNGKDGGSLLFSGSNSFVKINDALSLDLTTGMTLQAWIYPTTTLGAQPAILVKERSGHLSYALFANTSYSKPAGYLVLGFNSYGSFGTQIIPLNTWTHLATTYDGTNIRIYINGTLKGTKYAPGSMTTSIGALYIGGSNAISNINFKGRIDDVRVYNRALSDSEILTDMYTPVGGTPQPSTTRVNMATPATYTAQPGKQVTITLNWDRVPIPQGDSLQFMHLDMGSTQFSVDDHNVNSGSWSGSAPDVRTITIPASIATGTYDIRVGLSGGNPWRDYPLLMGTGVTDPGNENRYKVGTITITNTVDTTKPTVSITAPTNGATVSGSAVTVSANASDNVGVVGVQFKVNGINLGAEDTTSPYSVVFDSTTAPNGSYILTAVARDAAGNSTTSANVSVTVSNTPAVTKVNMATPATYTAQAGGQVTITLNWDRFPLAQGNSLQFMHLDNGTSFVSVDDHTVPSATWSGSAPDVRTITIPSTLAAGTYDIRVGLSGGNPWTNYPLAMGTGVTNSTNADPNLANRYKVGTITVTTAVDTTKPTVSITTPANNATVSGGAVTVSANASDNIGVVGVQFKMDGVNLGSEDLTSPYSVVFDSTTVTNGVHVLTAVARDAAGNSTTSSNISITVSNTVIDTTKPTVVMTAPANGAVLSGTSVIVSANASDNIGVAGVQFKIDGNNLGSEDTTSPYSVVMDSTLVSNGTHILTAVARDAAGNSATASSVAVTVSNTTIDTTPPQVALSAPVNGTTVSGGAVTVSANAADNVGVVGVQFKMDGVNLGSEDTTSPYSVVFDSTTVTNGSHVLTATARDAAGNSATSASVSITVSNSTIDTTKPTVSITTPANGTTVSGAAVTVSANAADNIGVVGVQFKIDGVNLGSEDTTSPYSIVFDLTTVTNGSHVLTATARDAAGNSANSANISITVSNSTTPPPPPSAGLVAAFNFNETSGTVLTDLSGAGNNGAITNATWNTTGKNGGSLTFSGSNSFAKVNDANSLDLTTGMTLQAWIYPTIAMGATQPGIIIKERSGTAGYGLFANSKYGVPVGYLTIGFNLYSVFATQTIPAGTWSHLAMTFDGANIRTYVNGVLKGTKAAAGAIATSTGPLFIGGSNIIAGSYFNGRIDDVRVYNRALSATEILNDMNTPVEAGTTPPAETTPPTVSLTAPANGATVSGGAVTVSANASDNVGVVGVQFKMDGVSFGPEDITSPYSVVFDSTTIANGSHVLTATARDAAGNTATSTSVSITVSNTTVDTTKPTVSITAPANGAAVSGTSVSVSANASDNVGVAGVQFKIDGNNLGAEDTSSPYSVVLNSTTVSNGSHTLTAVARDAAGNTATSTSVVITVSNTTIDTTPPTVSLTAPANNATVSGGAVTVSANASDNVGVVGVQFKMDGVNLGAEDTTSPYSVVFDSTTATNGTHVLTAVARDAAGNSTTSSNVSITISNTTTPPPPTTTRVNMATPSTYTATAGGQVTITLNWDRVPMPQGNLLQFMHLDNGTTFVSVDDHNVNSSTWSGSATDVRTISVPSTMASGTYDIRVGLSGGNPWTNYPLSMGTGVTNSTNADPNLANRYKVGTITISGTTPPSGDTTPPTVSMTAPSSGSTVTGTSVTVSANASDNIGVAGVQFKVDGNNIGSEDTSSPYSVVFNSTTVANGSHTLTAVARDAAGNTATSSGVTVNVSNSTTNPPPSGGAAGPRVTTFTNSGPITASSGQVIRGLRIANPNGPCVTISGVSGVTLQDNEIGPCGGAAVNIINGASNNIVEHNKVSADIERGIIVSGAAGNTVRKNTMFGVRRVGDYKHAIEITKSDRSIVVGNVITGAWRSDILSGYESSDCQFTDNEFRNISIDEPTGAAFTIGDATDNDGDPANPGRNNYIARNMVWDQTGGVPAGVFGSDSNTLLEYNCFSAGIQAYNYSGTFNGVTVRNNVINLSNSFVPDTSVIAGWNTNINSSDCRLVPGGTTPPPSTGDTTAPTVSMTAPSSGSTVTGTSVTVSANASDNVSVAGVQFKIDGNNIGAEDTSSPYSVVFNSTTVANGSHTFTAVARDAAGNTATSSGVTVTTSNTTTTPPPTTPPPTGTTRVNMASPSTYTATAGGQVTITLNWDRVPMAANYTQFMHIDNNGTILASVDDHMVNSSTWSGSATDVRTVTIPSSVPSGTYDIRVGLSGGNPWTDQPLLMGTGVTQISNRYKVGTITVSGGTTTPPPTTPPPTTPPPTTPPPTGGNCYPRTETPEPAGTVVYNGPGVIVPADYGCWHDTGYVVNWAGGYYGPDPNFKVFSNTVRLYGMGGLEWKTTEISAGNYNWARWDEALAKMKSTGVKGVVYNLFNVPDRLNRQNAGGGLWAMQWVPENEVVTWLNAVRAKVYQYGLTLTVEVANEVFTPDVGANSFWKGTREELSQLSDYVLNWRNAYAPEVKIWSPSIPGFLGNNQAFMDWLGSYPRRAEFDAFSLHLYYLTAENLGQPASSETSWTSFVEYRDGLRALGLGNKPIVDGEKGFGPGSVVPGTIYNYGVKSITQGISQTCLFFLGSEGNDETNLGRPFANAWAKADIEDMSRLSGRKITKVVRPNSSTDGRYWVQTDGQCYAGGGTTTPPPSSGDTTAPSVSMTAPSSGSTVTGTSVTVSANASDNVGVAGVQFKIDGNNIGSEDTSSPYSVTFNSTTVANGSHTFTAVARDASGNSATSSGVNVTVSNTTTTPPPTGTTRVNMATPSSYTASAGGQATITLNWDRVPMPQGNLLQFMHLDNGTSSVSVDDHNVNSATWSGSATDVRTITVPSTMASGTYDIRVGLSGGTPWVDVALDMGTGVTNSGGSAPNRYKVGTITISGGSTPPPTTPTASIFVSPTSITPDASATLTWSSTNSTSCTASGGWSGTKATSGTETVTASASTTYSLSCSGSGGTSSTVSATLNVGSTTPPPSGTAFYVSPNGSDSNAGNSASSPFQTFTRARDAMRGSSTKTVYVMGGTYNSGFPISLGSADAGQSWLAYPGQTPVLEGNNSTLTAIDINSTNNVTIRWLTIQNFLDKGMMISDSRNITIDSNTIKNTQANDWGKAPLQIWGTFANSKITHNLIDGSGYAGIEGNAVAGAGHDLSNVLIDSNAVYNTMLSVSDGGGIYWMDRSHSGAPMTISNNIVGGYGDTGKWSAGIYLDDQISNVTVRNNIVYGSGTHAINIHGGDRNRFENNIFHFDGGGILGLYQTDPANGSFGMGQNVLNCNIIYSNSPQANTGSNTGLWHYYGNPPTPPTMSNNLVWSSAGQLNPVYDPNPLRVDPRFVNPQGRNYNFQAGPPMSCFQPINTSQVGPLPNGGGTTPPPSTGDTTPPTVSMTAPSSGSTVTGTSVTVSANASDNIGVAGVQFKIDGNNIGAEDTSSPYSVTFNSTSVSNGSHTFTAVARDAAGNSTTSSGVTVTTSNTTTTPPPTGTTRVNMATPATYTALAGGQVTITLNWDRVPMPENYTQFMHIDNGTSFVSVDDHSVNSMSWSGSATDVRVVTIPASLASGTYDIRVGLTDNSPWQDLPLAMGTGVTNPGNSNRYKVGTITVSGISNPPPNPTPITVSITAPSNGATVSGSSVTVSANASSTIGIAGVQFKLNGANLGSEDTSSPYSVVFNSTTVADGTHTLTATARDTNGNIANSANVSVTVSNTTTPPPPSGGSVGPRVTSFTNSGPITATSGQVISGVRIQSSSSACIIIPAGATNVTVRDSDIGPCGGNVDIGVYGSGALIEHNYIHQGPRGIHVGDTSNVTVRKNKVYGDFRGYGCGRSDPNYCSHAIEVTDSNTVTIDGNEVRGSYPTDAVNSWQSFNLRVINNDINVTILHPDAGTLTLGDSLSGNPGGGLYVAGNVVRQDTGARPGIFGSAGGTLVERNCFPNGMTLMNYSGQWVDVVVRENVIGPGGYFEEGILNITRYENNINGTDCSLVPGGLPSTPPPSSGDTTPPTVSMTAPSNGSTVTGTSVAVSANASDNVGVAGVQFKVDGNNIGAEDTSSPYSVVFNSTTVANGSHTFTAVARDAAGNTATSSGVTVTTSNTTTTPPPTTPPPTGTTRVNMASPSTYTATAGGQVTITLNWDRVPMAANYTQFMHIDNNGTILASVDDHMVNSSTWSGSATDVRTVTIPSSVPSGTYDIRVGLSGGNPWTDQSLLMGTGVTQISNRYKVGTITVSGGTTTPPPTSPPPTTTPPPTDPGNIIPGPVGPTITSFTNSGPITAQSGQTITGLKISNPNGPCITVAGSNVRITNNDIGPCGTPTGDSTHVAIYINGGYSNITIDHNNIHDMRGGVYAVGAGSGIVIEKNYFKNVFGGLPRGNYVQFNGVNGTGHKLRCNIGEQTPYNQGGAKEDSFSIYNSNGTSSSPIEVAYNKLRGGSSNTGCGIMTGEEQSSYINVHHNNVIHPGVCGVSIAGGNNITLSDNKIYSNEMAGPGMYVWEWTNSGQPCFNHTVANNQVNWLGGGGNHFWNAGNCSNVNVTGNNFGANIGEEIWNEEFAACGTSGSTTPPSSTGDTTAPTVSMTAPSSGSTVTGTSVTVSANASDNVGVAGVQFKIDGNNIGAEDTSSPYSVVFNSTTVANGSHTFTAVARDAAGNTATSSGVTVTTSNTTTTPPPTTPPPTGTTRVNMATPSSYTATAGGQVTITLNWDRVPMAANYTQFMHIDNNGTILASVDDHMVNSSTWSGSATDVRTVTIPSSVPSGTYDIRVGLSGGNPWTDQPLLMGTGVTQINNRYKVGTITVSGGTTTPPPTTPPPTSPPPSGSNVPGPRVSSFTNSGPINASSGQVISGVRISNPNGPCITISGVSNVIVRDSDIGPCGGEGINVTGNASNITIEYNAVHDSGHGIRVRYSSGVNSYYNTIRNIQKTEQYNHAIEYSWVNGGTLKGNDMRGTFPSDVMSGFESSNLNFLGNYFDVNIIEPTGAAFTIGDGSGDDGNPKDPGRNNYIAGNHVRQSSAVPAGVFGSFGNVVIEHNLFANGIQAYNYVGDPYDTGADPGNYYFQDVTIRKNAIGPGSYVRRNGEGIQEYDTNVFKNPASAADVPSPGLGYYENGVWVNTYIP